MAEQFRFPSGATLNQVKKDAKRLKQTTNLPHHEALNAAARQHGVDMDWHKIASELPLPEFHIDIDFQCDVHFSLTHSQPVGLIRGSAWTGRSAMAAELCSNYLAKHGEVVCLYQEESPYSAIPGIIADAFGRASATVHGFRSRGAKPDQAFGDVMRTLSPAPRTLVVIEEPQSFPGFNLDSAHVICRELNVGLIALTQHQLMDKSSAPEWLAFEIEACDHLLQIGLRVPPGGWNSKQLFNVGRSSGVFDSFTCSQPSKS